MAYCKTCGAQLTEGVAFCTNCGTPLSARQTQPQQPPTQPYAQPQQPPAAAPSPFAPAQRTADRVFPSQQRKAQQTYGAAQANAPYPQERSGSAQAAFQAASYGARPYGEAQRGSMYGEVPSGTVVDWERFQPRTSPKSANRLIWAASILIFAVVVMVWTLLIR